MNEDRHSMSEILVVPCSNRLNGLSYLFPLPTERRPEVNESTVAQNLAARRAGEMKETIMSTVPATELFKPLSHRSLAK
jgi:hypothetical protein